MLTNCAFLFGLLVAWGVGGVVPWGAVKGLRYLADVPDRAEQKPLKRVVFEQSFFLIERTAFFVFSFLGSASHALTLAFIWMGLKLASGWNRAPESAKNKNAIDLSSNACCALAGSLFALGLSILGGLIAKGQKLF